MSKLPKRPTGSATRADHEGGLSNFDVAKFVKEYPTGPLADANRARELAESNATDAISLPEFIELTGIAAGEYGIYRITADCVCLRAEQSNMLEGLDASRQLAYLQASRDFQLHFPCSAEEFMRWYDRTRGTNGVSDFPLAPAFERARPSPGGRFSPDHGTPVPSPSIKSAFRVRDEVSENERWWNPRLRDALGNGLHNARASRGRARQPARWVPLLVGAWLIHNGHMSPAAVREALQEHFPDANIDLLGI